jgi:hypothetical protein
MAGQSTCALQDLAKQMLLLLMSAALATLTQHPEAAAAATEAAEAVGLVPRARQQHQVLSPVWL